MSADQPLTGDELATPAVDEPRNGHLVDVDVAWGGSGRDGDPWVKVSWDVERCFCSQPWRHR